jgi:hypothetical protein
MKHVKTITVREMPARALILNWFGPGGEAKAQKQAYVNDLWFSRGTIDYEEIF